MRVLPDVSGIDKEFDYVVPDHLPEVVVGSIVRVDLAGRRVAAWVVALIDPASVDRPLLPVVSITGWGPEPALVDLASWGAWRWAGRRGSLLTTASAPGAVRHLPIPALRPPAPPPSSSVPPSLLAELVAEPLVPQPLIPQRSVPQRLVLRLPPAADRTAVVAHVAQRGPTLVVVPSVDRAAVLAERLRRAGGDVALLPAGWAQARAGAGVVIGARAAAWAPCPGLAAVVVVDGHDEALVQEQAPTWGAVDVVTERARRADVPCVIISACPTLELLDGSTLLEVAPDAERAGWSVIEVVDRRHDDPRLGLYSRLAVDAVRSGGRVLCVLNRVGRARLLACTVCGSVADCERCGAAVRSAEPLPGDVEELGCPRCGLHRPVVCRECHSTRLRQLRVGVSRAREELEALAGRVVGEVTATRSVDLDADVLVGTEAVLHRVTRADTVVFLDFDQHLLAARYRADEEALALLARASRLTGGRHRSRDHPPGRVFVQTRLPDHPVLAAASVADPGRLSAYERPLRQSLRLPPSVSLATVSGPAAPAFVEQLQAQPVEVLGPAEDRWLVRAETSTALSDALAAVPRPPGRLRIEVDPQGV